MFLLGCCLDVKSHTVMFLPPMLPGFRWAKVILGLHGLHLTCFHFWLALFWWKIVFVLCMWVLSHAWMILLGPKNEFFGWVLLFSQTQRSCIGQITNVGSSLVHTLLCNLINDMQIFGNFRNLCIFNCPVLGNITSNGWFALIFTIFSGMLAYKSYEKSPQ